MLFTFFCLRDIHVEAKLDKSDTFECLKHENSDKQQF